MSQINYDYFLDDIMPDIVGAEVPFVMRHIRNAAIEFCERSWAWHLEALPIQLQANKAYYNLLPPVMDDSQEICQVIWVMVNEKIITPLTNQDKLSLSGDPEHYLQDYTEQITLLPTPSNAVAMRYEVALRPSRTSEGLNGSVGKRYFEAICNGAKAKLFEIPNKPWSDGQNSVFHRSKFEDAAAMAKDEVLSGLGRGPRRTKLVY